MPSEAYQKGRPARMSRPSPDAIAVSVDMAYLKTLFLLGMSTILVFGSVLLYLVRHDPLTLDRKSQLQSLLMTK